MITLYQRSAKGPRWKRMGSTLMVVIEAVRGRHRPCQQESPPWRSHSDGSRLPSRSCSYFLSTSCSPQQESGSEHEQAPASLSAQDLSTWSSSPQFSQTYTSPTFISLHDAMTSTSFPLAYRCAGRGGQRLIDSPGAESSCADGPAPCSQRRSG